MIFSVNGHPKLEEVVNDDDQYLTSKYGQGYDLDAVRDQLSAISLSRNSCTVTLNDPVVHAKSLKCNNAVLGVDSPHHLFPSASSTPCFLARIMHSERMNFFSFN